MLPNRETLLCRYAYDPLDRLVDCTPSAQATAQRFYMKDRVATEIQGAMQHLIMQHNDQLLAQKQRQGSATAQTLLLATDQQRSVLNVLDASQPHPFAYTPYGYRSATNGLLCLLGFNGERPDPVTGWYLLGNGYRAFNPVLMRFNSPDSWSPFFWGGINAYTYCQGDPVNMEDSDGHMPRFFTRMLAKFGIKTSKRSLPRSLSKQLLIGSTDRVSVMTPARHSLSSGKSSETLATNLTSSTDAGAHATIPAQHSAVRIEPAPHRPIQRSASLENMNEENIRWAKKDLQRANRKLEETVGRAIPNTKEYQAVADRSVLENIFTHANDVAKKSNYLSDLRKFPFSNTGKVRKIRKT